MKEEFTERVNNKCYGNKDWCGLERKLLDVASEVCGYTKGKPRHFEKWWWNEIVDVAVREKRGELFRTLKQSWNEKIGRNIVRHKKDAKRVVYMAVDQKAREAVERLIRVVMAVSC